MLPGVILQSLLSRSPYREKWGPFVQRRRGDGINQRAVAAFMAAELSDRTGVEYDPVQLKNRIARALKGDVFTDETAGLFSFAFDFSYKDSQELRRAIATSYLNQRTHKELRSAAPIVAHEKDHISLATTFVSYIDDDGFLTRFEVTQTIQIDVDETQYISPLFEGADLENITVLFGGELVDLADSDEETFNEYNRVWKLKIKLPRVFTKGEIHQFKYRCDLNEGVDDLIPLPVAEGEKQKYIDQVTFGPFGAPYYNLTMILRCDKTPQNMALNVWTSPDNRETLISEPVEENSKIFTASYPVLYKTSFGYAWEVSP